MTRIRGAVAAAVTPLTAGGAGVDRDAIQALVDFYVAAGLDGLLVLGTTGEGILLAGDERRAAATAFLDASRGRIPVVVHCGAQTTRDTNLLAEHAAGIGADGVAVIPPPYYALDAAAILRHLSSAAAACAPAPFYAYEFAARSGYAIPLELLPSLRDEATNFVGIKVSDSPYEKVSPYLVEGLDVFIGAEGLIARGMQEGAVGAVSGLAAALPELTITAVRSGSEAASDDTARVRDALQRFPFHAVLKLLLRRRGVPITDSVTAPLRTLDAAELAEFERLIEDPARGIAPLITR